MLSLKQKSMTSSSKKWYPVYDTKLHLMVRLQFRRSGECEVPVRVPSICQIELFKNHLYSIGLCATQKKTSQETTQKSVNMTIE